MRVLVTDANSKNALATVRALGSQGNHVVATGPKLSISHSSKFCSDRFITAGSHLSESELLEAVQVHSPNLIVPVTASAVELVGSVREKLDGQVYVALPNTKSLVTSFNKFEVQQLASQLGMEVPRYQLCRDFSELVAAVSQWKTPFVVRSNSHYGRPSIWYVNSEADRQDFLSRDLANRFFLSGDAQVQERVRGSGVGFFAVYQNGVLKRYMMHRRLQEFPASGGSSWFATSVEDDQVLNQGKMLLDALNWHGPAMVEFKQDPETLELHFVELNPKLWGSLDLTIEAGVNVPELLTKMASGETLQSSDEFQSGVNFWWPLDRLVSIFGLPKAIRLRAKTNVRLDDLAPSLNSLIQLNYVLFFEKLFKGNLGLLRHWIVGHGWKRAFLRAWNEWFGMPSKCESMIDEGLWVGAAPSRLGYFILTKVLGFRVLSLSKLSFSGSEDEHKTIPIVEFLEIDVATIERAVHQLEEWREMGSRVYVHCREGVGRAPTIAAAYLVKNGQTSDQAESFISSRRSVSRMNEKQRASLKRFEQHMIDSSPR